MRARVLCLVLRMIGTAENLSNPVATNIRCMRFLLFSDVITIHISVGCLVTKVQLPPDATLSQSKYWLCLGRGDFQLPVQLFRQPKILSLFLPDHEVLFVQLILS
jgi:hypothetical protein